MTIALVLVLSAQSDAATWIPRLGDDDPGVRDEASYRLRRRIRELEEASIAFEVETSCADVATQAAPVTGEDRLIAEKLRSIRITIDMQDAPLTAVVEYVREVSGLNFVIDVTSIEKPEETLASIKLADVVLDTALRAILHPRGMAHVVERGVVTVGSREKIENRVKLELYDAQDLVTGEEGEKLAEKIKRRIGPVTWNENKGRTLVYANGLLVVRARPAEHWAIRSYLFYLRENGAEPPIRPLALDAHLLRAALGKACQSEDLETRMRARDLHASLSAAIKQ